MTPFLGTFIFLEGSQNETQQIVHNIKFSRSGIFVLILKGRAENGHGYIVAVTLLEEIQLSPGYLLHGQMSL